ncbi:haloacid dehalogenase-like hydrolase [Streptomyces sp. NPDC007991]|uniref:HAD family hydrolase n=1 Tax=Streptomyces sp. NPDC007991 TaxID=3364803 RepID=UPI0036F08EDB
MGTSPLGSWSDGAAKRAIVEFVTSAAAEGSPDFVAPMDRVAVFDNDGTLWVEKPEPVQMPFVLAKLAQRLEADPSLAAERAYRAIAERDEAYFRALNDQDPDAVASMVEAIGSAWEGTPFGEFEAEAARYLESWRHERFGLPAIGLVYRPMLELFDYLRAYGWRLFVCSGGGRDFMRVICEDAWGLPRENVIGSAPEFAYRDGALVRRATPHGPVASGPESRSTSSPAPAGCRASRRATTTWTSRCCSPRGSPCSSCTTTTSASTRTTTARCGPERRPSGPAGRRSA